MALRAQKNEYLDAGVAGLNCLSDIIDQDQNCSLAMTIVLPSAVIGVV